MKGRWWVAITAVAVVSFMSGCAASRSTLDVPRRRRSRVRHELL